MMGQLTGQLTGMATVSRATPAPSPAGTPDPAGAPDAVGAAPARPRWWPAMLRPDARLVWPMAGLLLALSGALAAAQPVVPDGATATSVTTSPAGRISVGIAPTAPGGVSHNSYSSFSVPAAGVDLVNTGVNANMIINEVTSARRSFLNGPLTVEGRQAHVIIANPNGITVDGGRFINIGGLILSGGRVRHGAGPNGRDLVASAGSGDITVEGAGLSGSLTSLQLIAGRMKIDGPVTNEHASPFAAIDLTAGNAEIVLDPSAPANSTVRGVVRERRTGDGATSEILIDVTPRGALSASRVRLAATAAGAGVRFAGRGMASIGEFSIDAGGKVTAQGASITAERSVRISGAAVEVLNAPEAQSRIETIRGAVSLLARSGDIDIAGMISGANRDSDDPLSRGAVTLVAAGDIRLLSENADRLAIAFAANGDLHASAGGAIVNRTGRLLANGNVSLQAARLENLTDMAGGARDGAIQSVRSRGRLMWRALWRKRRKTMIITVDYGKPRIAGQQGYIAGASVSIDAGEMVNSGEINGLDGAVTITTDRLHNLALWTGTLAVRKQCGVTCSSRGETDIGLIGGAINATRGVSITARDSLLNERGQITAWGNLEINSRNVTGSAGFIPEVAARPAGMDNAFTGPRAWLSLRPAGGQFIAPEGSVTITSPNPVALNGGEIIARTGLHAPGGTRTAPESGPGNRHPGLLQDFLK